MKCDNPINKRLKTPISDGGGGLVHSIPLPCGKCLNCKQNRSAHWSFRLMQQLKVSDSSYFVTLTYETLNIPYTDKGTTTLVKKDVQDFIKRLRYYENDPKTWVNIDELKRQKRGVKIKSGNLLYYAVGEYGELRHRPHYHLIMFNVRNVENIKKAWPLGHVHIDECNNNTIDYTLKYLHKENKNYWWKVKKYGALQEFSLSSKNIGKNFLTRETIRYYRRNPTISYATTKRGYRISLPKYYRDKIFKKGERLLVAGMIKRKVEEAEEKARYNIERMGKNYDELKTFSIFARQIRLQNQERKRIVD